MKIRVEAPDDYKFDNGYILINDMISDDYDYQVIWAKELEE